MAMIMGMIMEILDMLPHPPLHRPMVHQLPLLKPMELHQLPQMPMDPPSSTMKPLATSPMTQLLKILSYLI